MHGDELGSHLLADILLRKRPVLYKHIHLDAVSERFMNDHTGNVGHADAFVLTGLNGLSVKQLDGGLACRLESSLKVS